MSTPNDLNRDEREAVAESHLAEARRLFGENLKLTRRAHPVLNTQIKLATAMDDRGFPGYSTIDLDPTGEYLPRTIARKISKYERAEATPPLHEASAIANLLGTTVDALTDPAGTIDTRLEAAELQWQRFADAVLDFVTARRRADAALLSFRTVLESLDGRGEPLFVPPEFEHLHELWGALSDTARAQLTDAENEHLGEVQTLREETARRRREILEIRASRMRAAAERFPVDEGQPPRTRAENNANLARAQKAIQRWTDSEMRSLRRKRISEPEYQRMMQGMIHGIDESHS